MPTLAPFNDMDPSPRVEITFTGGELSGSIDTITVHQISADGDVVVLNANRRPAAGGFFVTDYLPPTGIPVTYRGEQFNAAGTSLGFTATAVTQVDVPAGFVVVQDPLAPGNAVLVQAEQQFADTLRYSRDVKLYRAGLETVALMGPRGLLENVSLQVYTYTDAERSMLDAVLAEGYFVVRSMPPVPLPRVLHAVISAPTRVPLDARTGGSWSVYEITAMQVSRSGIDIVVPVVTYERYNDAFATYTAFNAAYATYLAAIANPPPAP